MPKSIYQIPHVALLVETSRSYGRDLLKGVRRYVTEHEPWSLFAELRALESQPPPWLAHWQGDGILARTSSKVVAGILQKSRIPTVELRSSRLMPGVPFVGVDNLALARLVADYFCERGFRRFGVYGLDSEDFFEERCDAFARIIRREGLSCSVHWASGSRERPSEWERQQEELTGWLHSLPKPVAVLACTDQLGFWLLDACLRSQIAVPEEVAVISAENDESLCALCTPLLSSVKFNGEASGHTAAALLDQMMRGKPTQAERILFPPLGIITRQSSDIVAIPDRQVAAAVQFIRHRAGENISVDDVAASVRLSRSTLERRMRDALGRLPRDEIALARVNRVKELLAETSLPLKLVAEKAGFGDEQHLTHFFKKKTGQTPGVYRRSTHASPQTSKSGNESGQ